jgi:hypothetical protein
MARGAKTLLTLRERPRLKAAFVAGQYLHARLKMWEKIEQRGFDRAQNGRIDMCRTGFSWRPAFPAKPRATTV